MARTKTYTGYGRTRAEALADAELKKASEEFGEAMAPWLAIGFCLFIAITMLSYYAMIAVPLLICTCIVVSLRSAILSIAGLAATGAIVAISWGLVAVGLDDGTNFLLSALCWVIFFALLLATIPAHYLAHVAWIHDFAHLSNEAKLRERGMIVVIPIALIALLPAALALLLRSGDPGAFVAPASEGYWDFAATLSRYGDPETLYSRIFVWGLAALQIATAYTFFRTLHKVYRHPDWKGYYPAHERIALVALAWILPWIAVLAGLSLLPSPWFVHTLFFDIKGVAGFGDWIFAWVMTPLSIVGSVLGLVLIERGISLLLQRRQVR